MLSLFLGRHPLTRGQIWLWLGFCVFCGLAVLSDYRDAFSAACKGNFECEPVLLSLQRVLSAGGVRQSIENSALAWVLTAILSVITYWAIELPFDRKRHTA